MSAVDPYAFMSPAAAAAGVALRTPMERRHVAAGATIEERDGWRIGVYADDADGDPWMVDASHLGKLDLRATAAGLDELTGGLAPGEARADGDVWTLRLTPTHGYVLCPFDRVEPIRSATGGAAIDLTCGLAGVAVGGARRRDVMNRSSGLDVRPARFPANRCMAGSVMRVPTLILNEGEHISMFVGWEYGEYFWDAILDAGATLGIGARTPAVARSREAVA
jgi:glycine cleavage system aminomethyltransferase T